MAHPMTAKNEPAKATERSYSCSANRCIVTYPNRAPKAYPITLPMIPTDSAMAILLCTCSQSYSWASGRRKRPSATGQHLADHRYGPVDSFVALGGVGTEPEGGEG